MVDFFTGLDEPGGMRAVAHSMNLRYCEQELDRQYWIDNPGGVPAMPLFKHGTTSELTNMIYGTFGGLSLQAFDFEAITYPDDPGHDTRSCVLFALPANFTTLTVNPHTKLSRLQERGSIAFTQRYRVLGRDAEVAELVLDDPMKNWLMTLDPALRIELSGGALLGHVPAVAPDAFPLLLQQVYGIYLRIPDKAWARYGSGLPA
jgi:hypothetical protein